MNDGVMQGAGPVAAGIGTIAWVMFIGGAIVLAGVMALLFRSLRRREGRANPVMWILGGGVALPAVVLGALFAWALPHTPSWKPVPPPGALVISVTGRLWWWEVRYQAQGGSPEFVTANEIRIPVGQPVYLALASADVIHSFWVPALAGKVDMVPGRMQHLLLSADRPGTFRGQCAEYCGEQHARMALHVVAEPADAFEAWRRAQAAPAAAPSTPQLAAGRDAFLANRCDACHTVRGATGDSRLGPDLTHIGSRLHLAAGTLPNSAAALAHWISHVQQVKQGARMPSYDRLDAATLAAMAQWLESLK